MKKKVFFSLLVCLFAGLFSSCSLFVKETPDETDGMNLLSYDELKTDIEKLEEWTTGKWNITVIQIEKTKRSTNTYKIENFPLFGDEGTELFAIFYALILPTEENFKSEESKSKYQNPIPAEEDEKQQYEESLVSYKLHLSKDKKVLILDIFTKRFDKKYEISTDITNRYKFTKKK